MLAGDLLEVDQFTRSHGRAWEIVERRSAKLVSLHEQFDTSTPAGSSASGMLVGWLAWSQNIALRVAFAAGRQAWAAGPRRLDALRLPRYFLRIDTAKPMASV